MRTLSLLLLGLLGSASSQTRPAVPAAACTTATERCAEWVTLGGGPARSMIYRTHSLDARNEHVRRALIMVHGTNRNADHYFSTAVSAAFLAGALEDAVVISPRIASAAGNCRDVLAPNEVSWSCTGDSWRSGGSAASHPDLTSFDFVDAILKKLANRTLFPNLRAIVVAGHSAGGQFVARYQMANRVHDTLSVAITYVVANPSSYAWPDATRPQPTGDAAPDNAKGAWETEKVHAAFSYGAFDASACPNYDRWPAGLANRSGGPTQPKIFSPTTFFSSHPAPPAAGSFARRRAGRETRDAPRARQSPSQKKRGEPRARPDAPRRRHQGVTRAGLPSPRAKTETRPARRAAAPPPQP